jgi:sugar lactone lactonase YvrE
MIGTVKGLEHPESARYDSTQDVFFISNVNGQSGVKDDNGFVSRVRPDGTIDSLHFIAGGRNGVTLDSPMGIAVLQDTLWVADRTTVRGFDARTGAPVASIDLAPQGATFLNDVCTGPDGSIYISDTGLETDSVGNAHHTGTDHIFRILPRNRSAAVAVEGRILEGPNGITWDPIRGRFLAVSFVGKHILSWMPQSAPHSIATGPGQFDGVEVLADGRTLVTSWADSSVLLLTGKTLQPVITRIPEPADLGVDTKRHHIAVPMSSANEVELFDIPRSTQVSQRGP